MTYQYYSTPKHNTSAPRTIFGDAKTFHLTLVSAVNLPCSDRLMGRKIKVHAEILLDGGNVKKTRVDEEGGTNPTWNFHAHYSITDYMRKTGGDLVVRLYYKRTVGHTLIGEVKIHVNRLFDTWRNSMVNAETYHVQGDPHVRLNISYEFR